MAADIRAAEHALKLNAAHGDALRAQLAQRVQQFRSQLASAGLAADGGLFPVQTLKPTSGLGARQLHERLLSLGVRAVLRRSHTGEPRLSFVITARHRPDEIERAVNALAQAAKMTAYPQPKHG